MPYMMKTMSCK